MEGDPCRLVGQVKEFVGQRGGGTNRLRRRLL